MFFKNDKKNILFAVLIGGKQKKNIVAFFYASQRLTVPSGGSDMKGSLFKGIEIFLYSRVWSNSLVGPLLPNHKAKNVYNFPVCQSSLRMPFFFKLLEGVKDCLSNLQTFPVDPDNVTIYWKILKIQF